METFEHTVEGHQANERIDKLLAKLLPHLSRERMKELIKMNLVTVNGKLIKASYKCQQHDKINVQIPAAAPLDIQPEPIDLDIVFEDADIIIVNKPRGMVVHPAPGHESGTLVNGLLAHCRDLSGINGVIRPGIVHRLDKDTSGLIMAAKNDQAHESLARQLKERTVERIYQAIVHGQIGHRCGTVDAPIGRDGSDRKKMAVTENGREAITHFHVLERFSEYTLIECRLVTGRTHQIRVHMRYIGHPVAGDPKYGPKKTLPIKGQALHAASLSFFHPSTKEKLKFSAPLPEDMKRLLHQFRA